MATGTALTALDSAITRLIEEDELIDKMCLLERLSDATRLVMDIIYQQTEARKTFIIPGVNKQMRTVLEKYKTEE